MNLSLDRRLENDTHQLGKLDNCLLLLSKNAHFPWFILVPATDEIEYHRLDNALQKRLQQHINAVAEFIETHFDTDKINIATIGNVVSQLHIHIIGRSKNDPCWPGVVWGTEHFKPYSENEIEKIKIQIKDTLEDSLV